MIKEFQTYLEKIVEMTCGFKPTVKVLEIAPGTLQAFLEGTQDEQALMMGREGKTITALTRFALIFGKRHQFFPYIYVRRKSETDDAFGETLKEILK